MSALRAAIVHGARGTTRRGSAAHSPRAGDGFEFAQLRAYVEGDDPRRIDWAASARGAGLQTRVYLEETALILAALVDESRSLRVGRRHRLSDAAGDAMRAWFAAAGPDDRVVRVVDDRLVSGLRPALHVRAALPFDLVGSLELAARVLPHGASLLALSDGFDLPDDAAAGTLRRLARRCDATILIARDPWRDGWPLRGFHRMRDAETGRTRVLFFGARARARYAVAVAERERRLTERFAAAGWRVGALDERDGRGSLERAFGVR